MSLIMAHRGARNLWAENSLSGFRETVKHRFDSVEFDLHLTDAGEIVVMHDATLERTTTGQGPTRAMTAEARLQTRVKGPQGQILDECVPLFAEALEVLAAQEDLELWVELKSDAEGRPYPGLVEAAAQELRRFGLQDRAALHSFDIEVVLEITKKAPEFKRLISVNHDWAARQGGIEALLTRVEGLVDIVGIHHALFEEKLAEITALRPLSACSVWTLNEPDLMRRWIARKPAFLVSDDPVLLREMMREEALA